MPDVESLGELIGRCWLARGFPQKALAGRLGVKAAYVSQMVHGKRGIGRKKINSLAEALEVDPTVVLRALAEYERRRQAPPVRGRARAAERS